MSKLLSIVDIVNGLNNNVKIFLVIVIVAIVLTKLTPGENKMTKRKGSIWIEGKSILRI